MLTKHARALSVRRYQDLIRRLNGDPNRYVDRLPPFLCREAARGRLVESSDVGVLYTGLPGADLTDISVKGIPIKICLSPLHPDVMSDLKLQRFSTRKMNERLLLELEKALSALENLYTPAWNLVSENTSMIAWLSPMKGVAHQELFSSSSFHEFPHCTLLTDLALRHIPANVVFQKNTTYALQENLFHESLHEWFCEYMENASIFAGGNKELQNALIHIPWRGTDWTLEKALHGYIVYVHILQMRKHVLSERKIESGLAPMIETGIREAINASRMLGDGIEASQNLLSPEGRELLVFLRSLERQP